MYPLPRPAARLFRILLFFALAAMLLPSALTVSADGRPQRGKAFRCTSQGQTPAPNSSQAQVKFVSLAFQCFDAQGRLVLPTDRLFDAVFFVDGVARDFQRAGEFDTEILFIEFPEGLPAGVHTVRVVVEGRAVFAWRFTVTSGGASHSSNGQDAMPADARQIAKTSASPAAAAVPAPRWSATCAGTVTGQIAACRPAPDLGRLGKL